MEEQSGSMKVNYYVILNSEDFVVFVVDTSGIKSSM
jgi:hypothetical protein